MVFKTDYHLLQVESIARIFLSGRLRRVLLYSQLQFFDLTSPHALIKTHSIYGLFSLQVTIQNSFLFSSNFCHLLITFTNSLDPHQDQSGSKLYDTLIVLLKKFLLMSYFDFFFHRIVDK